MKSVTLRVKIYLLSVIASVFLLAVIIVSYANIIKLSSTYKNYSDISEIANRNLELARDIETLKTSVQHFTYTRYSDVADDVDKLYQKIIRQLNEETKSRSYSDGNMLLMKKHLSKYFDTFLELKKKVEIRHKISVEKKLLLVDIKKNIHQYFSKEETLKAKLQESNILRSLYNAESYALYFLDTLDNGYIKKSKRSLKKLKKLLKSLLLQKSTAIEYKTLEKVKGDVKVYSKMLTQELQQTKGYLFLVNVVMAAESYEVLYQVNNVTKQSQQQLSEINASAKESVGYAVNVLITAGIIFFIALITFSFLVTRSIVRPIRSLTEAFSKLTHGDIDAVIPTYVVVDDDIGELTHSAQSFLHQNIELSELLALRTELTEELTLSEERFSLALDGADDGLWDWNLMSDHVFYSATWERMFLSKGLKVGYSFETWKQRIHPDDLKAARSDIKQYLEGNSENYHSEMRMKASDGEYIHILSKGKAVFDENGHATRMLGFHIDMSKQKELEHYLQEAKLQSDNANKAKSDFLANMSHEIRTPLNGIIGLTDLVLKTTLTESQEEYLKKSQASSHALLRVINDILDYSKIEAGKLDLEEKNFELHNSIENIRDLFEYQAHKKGIFLNFNLNVDAPLYIIGDSLRLTQVLINLVGNALKFTTEGSVSIITECIEQSDEKINLEFRVKDSGIGMNEETVSKLFQEFSQADTSITRKFGGTGLGLAISKQLVQMMGGKIWVESAEGQGSSFIFSIEFTKGEEELEVQNIENFSSEDLQLIKNLEVLVAEDNLTNQLVIRGILEEYGVNVTIANNGQLAVDAAKEKVYDVVLMDLQMPVMDGFESAKTIRSFATYQHIPIFALSAAVMQEDKALTLKAGMNEHLAKPIEYKILIQTMIDYIKKSKDF
jgi:PAS domain S-box-containing protein